MLSGVLPMQRSTAHSWNGTGERDQTMNDISQDKEACADIWLHTGQRVQPCCCVCGREFGNGADRCAQDVIHCTICRLDFDRYHAAKRRREEIPRLTKRLERLLKEEKEDPCTVENAKKK